MLPAIFGENLFDDVWNDPFDLMPLGNVRNALYGKHAKAIMKTDVRETDNSYEVDVDLPGFKKDEIKVELKDGYLTISAAPPRGWTRTRKTRRAATSGRSVTPASAAAASMSASP